jgi:hypothetical protein
MRKALVLALVLLSLISLAGVASVVDIEGLAVQPAAAAEHSNYNPDDPGGPTTGSYCLPYGPAWHYAYLFSWHPWYGAGWWLHQCVNGGPYTPFRYGMVLP